MSVEFCLALKCLQSQRLRVLLLVSLGQIAVRTQLLQLFKDFSSPTRECRKVVLISGLGFFVVTLIFAHFAYVFWHVTYETKY